jgi:hypothetical protein
MSEPLIVSIPHSGTRFLRTRLGIREIKHTIEHWPCLLKATEDRHIISPIREPMSVWASYWHYNRDVALQLYFRAFYTMHALTLVREIDWIAVDLQYDPRIENWEPVSDNPSRPDPHYPPDFRHIYDLPFVQQFYKKGRVQVPKK